MTRRDSVYNSFAFVFVLVISARSGPMLSTASSNRIRVADRVAATTSPEFVSFAYDTLQLLEKPKRVDFVDPQLIYLASQLTPSILRLGGTVADYVYYQIPGVNEDTCKASLPHSKKHKYYCLDVPRKVNPVLEFANATNSKLLFGLSIGYPAYPDRATEAWNASNARALLQYWKDTGYDKYIYGYEVGNEVNDDVSPSFQSKAFIQ